MKKFIMLVGTIMLLAGITADAQAPQPPAKKATTKPIMSTAPKPASVNAYLPIGDRDILRTASSHTNHPIVRTSNKTVVANTPKAAAVQPVNKTIKRPRR